MRTNWKLIAACLLCVLAAHAQYTTIGSSDAPADSVGVLNAKFAFTVAASAPSTCVKGKEGYIDSGTDKWYICTATNTWSEVLLASQTYTNPSSLHFTAGGGLITGFELPLTFNAPLSRSVNAVSLTVCSEGLILKVVSGVWACAADQTTTGGSGITSLNGLSAGTQLFSRTNDTNVTVTIGTSGTDTHTFTLGWTGTLAAGRLNANVVHSVVNDTNVTGSITAQVLTLNWTGTLAKARQHSATVYSDQANTYSAGFKQTFTSSASTAAVNYAPYAGDPSSLFDGDAWYSSATGLFKARIASTTKTFLFTDGNAATASALAANGANCPAGSYALGVDASGAAEGCTDVATPLAAKAPLTGGGTSGTWPIGISGNAATATALAANGTNCSTGYHPLGVDASGNAESCTADATTTGTPAYTSGLIAGPDTTKTIAASTHGYTTGAGTACPLTVAVYDNNSPRKAIMADWGYDPATCDVTVYFGAATSNYYVVINGATGPQGPAGSGSSQTSIFASGSSVMRQVECQHGTVSYTALTAAATSQEITIQSSIASTVRWEQALISETTQFTNATGLTVTMGRPGGSTNYEMSGVPFPLLVSSGDTNYWSFRPIPPAITGAAYSIVLNFSTTSGNLGNGSATLLTGGVATWEVCGYAAQ